jgi:chromosome segregation ATPase
MKSVQTIVTGAILVALGAVAYQYFTAHSLDGRVGKTERQIEENNSKIQAVEKVAGETRETLQKHGKEILTHAETIGIQGRDIGDLQKRVTAAEGKIVELSQASKEDRTQIEKSRAEIAQLRSEIENLNGQKNDDDRKRHEIDDLRKELRKSLDQSQDIDRRMSAIEKQLGIERPQP